MGILAGGIVAVLAQHFASRDARALAREAFEQARRLQRADRGARNLELFEALEHEIIANTFTLRKREAGGAPALLTRSAYEAARALDFPDDVLAAMTAAYVEADTYNAGIHMLRTIGATGNTRVLDVIAEIVKPTAALKAFEAAVEAFAGSGFRAQLEAAAI